MKSEPKEIDKSGWGLGPWQSEPDRIEWRHNGVPCLMVRQRESGHWCGYAAVEPGHKWHGLSYSGTTDEEGNYIPSALDVNVHGGITYAEKCAGQVCHVPLPGEPDDVWWLGFDCNHYGDYGPRAATLYPSFHDHTATYKTASYVKAETERLADQIIAAR